MSKSRGERRKQKWRLKKKIDNLKTLYFEWLSFWHPWNNNRGNDPIRLYLVNRGRLLSGKYERTPIDFSLGSRISNIQKYREQHKLEEKEMFEELLDWEEGII